MGKRQHVGPRLAHGALGLLAIFLAAGFAFLRWPVDLPFGFGATAWFGYVFDPLVGGSTMTAVRIGAPWWPDALGIVLLGMVLVAVARPRGRALPWGSLLLLIMGLGSSLGFERAFHASFAEVLWSAPLVSAVPVSLAVGIGLIGSGLAVEKGSLGAPRGEPARRACS
jgi:hypothetical protein